MITYELAKQIKDAGFTQIELDALIKRRGYYILDGDPRMRELMVPEDWTERGLSEVIYIPTLSEIIEACGYEHFNSLVTNHEKVQWMAVGNKLGGNAKEGTLGKEWGDVVGYGLIPEEAVANLWLALNIK